MMNNIPRPEYPRPRLVRKDWQNLNGKWEFEIDHGNSGIERKFYEREKFNSEILVPFAPESKLSGIEYIDFMKSVWYKRTFTLTKENLAGRVLIHFGAVDWMATVWINGTKAGSHKGGYTPFYFDITDIVTEGENTVVLNAYDDITSPLQAKGKQSEEYYNHSCVYTRTTGIWQTVWLEFVPDSFVEKLKLTPDVDNEKLHISALFNKEGAKEFKAEAFFEGKAITQVTAKITGRQVQTSLDIPSPVLWEPGKPALYDLKITAGDDSFTSYFGMRKVEIDGYVVKINGKSVFQRLVLDQGFYPDSIITAPSDDALRKDIELSMAAGFNGARLHMKVFEPGTIYWADKLGYIIWGEYPNWGLDISRKDALLTMLPEWLEAVERDYNSPAIIGWCPFNETHDTRRLADILTTVYAVTRAVDQTRPIIDTSGYIHAKTDIYDVHNYEQDVEKFAAAFEPLLSGNDKDVYVNFPKIEKYEGQPYFVSEFGGALWDIDNDNSASLGYGKTPENIEEFYKRFDGLCSTLLSNKRICAYCYTQLTDVFQERNGIYSFSRAVKFDLERLSKIQKQKAAIED